MLPKSRDQSPCLTCPRAKQKIVRQDGDETLYSMERIIGYDIVPACRYVAYKVSYRKRDVYRLPDGKQVEWLIKWEGWDVNDATWWAHTCQLLLTATQGARESYRLSPRCCGLELLFRHSGGRSRLSRWYRPPPTGEGGMECEGGADEAALPLACRAINVSFILFISTLIMSSYITCLQNFVLKFRMYRCVSDVACAV